MADKQCDNKSVGMLVWENGKLLLIERKNLPFGFAPPAGHLDGDDFEQAATRELSEEVGLEVKGLKLIAEGRKENSCRRGSKWHYWKIYKIEASGDLKRSESETKQAGWYSKSDLLALAQKTEKYLSGKILEKEWEKYPGFEPVWYEWLKQLQII